MAAEMQIFSSGKFPPGGNSATDKRLGVQATECALKINGIDFVYRKWGFCVCGGFSIPLSEAVNF